MKKKSIYKFIIVFILSFIGIELLELLLEHIFGVNLESMKWGWAGFVLIYGFKFHIFCCLLPAIFASYKCRHKKCHHDHCQTK